MQKRALVQSSVISAQEVGLRQAMASSRCLSHAEGYVFEAAVIVQYPLHRRPLFRNNSDANHVENNLAYS
jgi:hypothetical protein